jgi:hypothetical protein
MYTHMFKIRNICYQARFAIPSGLCINYLCIINTISHKNTSLHHVDCQGSENLLFKALILLDRVSKCYFTETTALRNKLYTSELLNINLS